MRLTKLHVQNIFSFLDTTVTLDRRVTSIIGENDTGKTNLLRCLHAIFGESGSIRALDKMRCQFAKGPTKVTAFLAFDESEKDVIRSRLKTKANLASGQLQISCSPEKATLAWGTREQQSKDYGDAECRQVLRHLLQTVLFETTIRPIRGSVRISELKEHPSCPEARFLALGGFSIEHLESLATGHTEGLIALGTAGQELTKQLRSEWSQSSIKIHPYPASGSGVDSSIEFRVSDALGATVPLAAKGDGLKWFLSFFTELRSMIPKPDVQALLFLFDEPGIHLHPQAQRDLCRLFNEDLGAGTNRQVLYTTHSPFMLDWSRPHQVRVLASDGSAGSTLIDKPYHSSERLNFWEPFRRNLGLFLGDLGLLGSKNLLVEGVSDQILLSYLGPQAKMRGLQEHLDLGERQVIPFGNHQALGLIAGTCLAYEREVVVLVDSDHSGKQAADALAAANCTGVPVFSLCDFARLLFPKEDFTIEDIFEREWYLSRVNEFYSAFPWFSEPVQTCDLSEELPIGKALEKCFRERAWKDNGHHTFSKVAVAVHIASGSPPLDFDSMRILFATLCRRIESPFGVLSLGICKKPTEPH